MTSPHPRVFCAKSSELPEKNELSFLCVQKGSQECEKKDLADGEVDRRQLKVERRAMEEDAQTGSQAPASE